MIDTKFFMVVQGQSMFNTLKYYSKYIWHWNMYLIEKISLIFDFKNFHVNIYVIYIHEIRCRVIRIWTLVLLFASFALILKQKNNFSKFPQIISINQFNCSFDGKIWKHHYKYLLNLNIFIYYMHIKYWVNY